MLHESFSHEFKIIPAQQRKITERFNSHRQIIQKLMNEAMDENENLKHAIAVFKIDDKNYQKTIEKIINPSSNRDDAARQDLLIGS